MISETRTDDFGLGDHGKLTDTEQIELLGMLQTIVNSPLRAVSTT
jgi:hypothetical protein